MISVMLLGAQVFAAVHFMFVSHTVDVRTGTVVRCGHTHAHEAGEQPNPYPDNEAPERDGPKPQKCQVYALLQQAQTLTSSISVVQPATVLETISSPVLDTTVHCQLRVYLVSPANSPPVRTLV